MDDKKDEGRILPRSTMEPDMGSIPNLMGMTLEGYMRDYDREACNLLDIIEQGEANTLDAERNMEAWLESGRAVDKRIKRILLIKSLAAGPAMTLNLLLCARRHYKRSRT